MQCLDFQQCSCSTTCLLLRICTRVLQRGPNLEILVTSVEMTQKDIVNLLKLPSAAYLADGKDLVGHEVAKRPRHCHTEVCLGSEQLSIHQAGR